MDQLDYTPERENPRKAPDAPTGRAWVAEAVFVHQATRAYNLARRMLGDEAAAEKVTHDALLYAVDQLDDLADAIDLTSRLRGVVVQAVLRLRRSRAREAVGGPLRTASSRRVYVETPTPSPDEPPVGLIEAVIRRLPEACRDIYVLADIEGCTLSTVSELLGVGAKAVKSRLQRARVLMRGFLVGRPAEPPPA